MMRKILPLLLLVGLSLPVPAASQSRPSGQPSAGEAQSDIFMGALQEILRRHRNAPSDSLLWAGALNGVLESLNDPYASVFTPQEVVKFQEDNTGNYSGIGVQIQQLNDRVTITKVFRETPADHTGLLEGDVIVGVNGHDATEWTTETASDSIRGQEGTQVRVQVQRPGFAAAIPFTLTRAQVHVPAVTGGIVQGTQIGYLVLDRVTRGSAEEVDSVLRVMNGAQGLIIDLRRNPGGYLDESLMISDVFLRPGQKLASLQQRATGPGGGNAEESWNARNLPRMANTPIVILVDEYTASAAEIVTGALQDHDRALVLGQRTFGKGIVQSVLDLPHGHQLRITTGTWHTPLGRSLQRDRDAGGRPLDEDSDAFATVRTASGRELINGGGVFPDIIIADDTLRTIERELLERSAELDVALTLRIAEFGFEEAQRVRQSGQTANPVLSEDAFQAFLLKLRSDGIPGDMLDNPAVRDYLAWRSRVALADRLSNTGAGARARMDRDPVLAEAMRLLQEARTQDDLYAAARRVNSAAAAPGRPGS